MHNSNYVYPLVRDASKKCLCILATECINVFVIDYYPKTVTLSVCALYAQCVRSGTRNIFVFHASEGLAQWLRCCATNRTVVGSIPAGVIGIFH